MGLKRLSKRQVLDGRQERDVPALARVEVKVSEAEAEELRGLLHGRDHVSPGIVVSEGEACGGPHVAPGVYRKEPHLLDAEVAVESIDRRNMARPRPSPCAASGSSSFRWSARRTRVESALNYTALLSTAPTGEFGGQLDRDMPFVRSQPGTLQ